MVFSVFHPASANRGWENKLGVGRKMRGMFTKRSRWGVVWGRGPAVSLVAAGRGSVSEVVKTARLKSLVSVGTSVLEQAGGNYYKEKREPRRRAKRLSSTAIGREEGSCKEREMLPLRTMKSW